MANYTEEIQNIMGRLQDILETTDEDYSTKIDYDIDINNFLQSVTSYWNETVERAIDNFDKAVADYGNVEGENGIVSTEHNAAYDYDDKYVSPNPNLLGEEYVETRGDSLTSVLQNGKNLSFTVKDVKEYLTRLIMPQYSRRVEIEDLNRNFWVIGQNLSLLNTLVLDIENAPWMQAIKDAFSEIVGLWDNVYRIWQAILYLAEKIPTNYVDQEDLLEVGNSVNKTQVIIDLERGSLKDAEEWLYPVLDEKHGVIRTGSTNEPVYNITDMYYFGEYKLEEDGSQVVVTPPEWFGTISDDSKITLTKGVIAEVPWLIDSNGSYIYNRITSNDEAGKDNLNTEILMLEYRPAEGYNSEKTNGGFLDDIENIVTNLTYDNFNGLSFTIVNPLKLSYSPVGTLKLYFEEDLFPTFTEDTIYTIDNNVTITQAMPGFDPQGIYKWSLLITKTYEKYEEEMYYILTIQSTNWELFRGAEEGGWDTSLTCTRTGLMYNGYGYDYPHIGGIIQYEYNNEIHYLAYDLSHPYYLSSKKEIRDFFGVNYAAMEKGQTGESYFSLNKVLYQESVDNPELLQSTTETVIGPIKIHRKSYDSRPLSTFVKDIYQLNVKMFSLTKSNYMTRYPVVWDRIPDSIELTSDLLKRSIYKSFNNLFEKFTTIEDAVGWSMTDEDKAPIYIAKALTDLLQQEMSYTAVKFNTTYNLTLFFAYLIESGADTDKVKEIQSLYYTLSNKSTFTNEDIVDLNIFFKNIFTILGKDYSLKESTSFSECWELSYYVDNQRYLVYLKYDSSTNTFSYYRDSDENFNILFNTLIPEDSIPVSAQYATVPNPFLITSFDKELLAYRNYINYEGGQINYWQERKGDPLKNLWILKMDLLPEGNFLYGHKPIVTDDGILGLASFNTFKDHGVEVEETELHKFLTNNGALVSFRVNDKNDAHDLDQYVSDPGLLTKYICPFESLSGYWFFFQQGNFSGAFLDGGMHIAQTYITCPMSENVLDVNNNGSFLKYRPEDFYDVSFSIKTYSTFSNVTDYNDSKITDIISINQPIPIYTTSQLNELDYDNAELNFLYTGKSNANHRGYILERIKDGGTSFIDSSIGAMTTFSGISMINNVDSLSKNRYQYSTKWSESDNILNDDNSLCGTVWNYLYNNNETYADYTTALDRIFVDDSILNKVGTTTDENGNVISGALINQDYYGIYKIKCPAYKQYVPIHYEGVGGLVPFYNADKIEWVDAQISDLMEYTSNDQLSLSVTLDFSNTYALDPQFAEIVCTPRVQRQNKLSNAINSTEYGKSTPLYS